MGLQSGGSPKFKEFWDSQLGSPALKKEERQKKLQAIKCKAKKNIDFVTFFLHYAPKIIIFKRSPANFGKSKKWEAKLAGIFDYLDPNFIKIKYVYYADNSLLRITELEKK